MSGQYENLSEFVDALQRVSRYTFTRSEAESAIGLKRDTLTKALQRLVLAGRLHSIRRGFYVIVPLEHSAAGIIPSDWFIDDLMKFLGQPYYVGVLTAAALHGAAHQRPQEYEVVVSKSERVVRTPKLRIRFFRHGSLADVKTQGIKTFTGHIPVSTPEYTALDLVRFSKQIGGLDAVVTVLAELGEKIDPASLLAASANEKVCSHVQRLGWLLDHAGWNNITQELAEWLAGQRTSKVPLNAALGSRKGEKDSRWNVIVNDHPKSDI